MSKQEMRKVQKENKNIILVEVDEYVLVEKKVNRTHICARMEEHATINLVLDLKYFSETFTLFRNKEKLKEIFFNLF